MERKAKPGRSREDRVKRGHEIKDNLKKSFHKSNISGCLLILSAVCTWQITDNIAQKWYNIILLADLFHLIGNYILWPAVWWLEALQWKGADENPADNGGLQLSEWRSEVERRAISMQRLLEKGIIWEWRGRRLGCFLSRTQECRAGGSQLVCLYAYWCVCARQESLTPTDSGSSYQGLNRGVWRGENCGVGVWVCAHSNPTPTSPILALVRFTHKKNIT